MPSPLHEDDRTPPFAKESDQSNQVGHDRLVGATGERAAIPWIEGLVCLDVLIEGLFIHVHYHQRAMSQIGLEIAVFGKFCLEVG